MRFTRTIITLTALALAGVTVVTGVGEGTADAHPADDHAIRPVTFLAAVGGEAGWEPEVYEVDVAGHGPARVVATGPEGSGVLDVERAPDGTGYYAAANEDLTEIRRIGTDDFVANGWAPAVSPDGRRLAFAYYPDDPAPCEGNGLAVLELATGEVRRFPGPTPAPGPRGCPEGEGSIESISWAPDSRRLAYERVLYMGGHATVRILDTGTARDLSDAELLDPARQYSHPAWLADGRIAVVERDEVHGLTIKTMDPDTGRVTQFSATDWLDGSVNSVDADASGRHLLVSVDGVSHTPRLFVLEEFGATEELDQAWAVAVW